MSHLAMELKINHVSNKTADIIFHFLQKLSSLAFVFGVFLLAVFSVLNFYK
jgi:hypothetical protein